MDSPALIPLSTVETVFVPGDQRMHRIFGVKDVLRLRRVDPVATGGELAVAAAA